MFWHFLGWKNKFFQNCSKLPKNHFRTIKILFFFQIFRDYKGGWVFQTKSGKFQIFFFLNPSLSLRKFCWIEVLIKIPWISIHLFGSFCFPHEIMDEHNLGLDKKSKSTNLSTPFKTSLLTWHRDNWLESFYNGKNKSKCIQIAKLFSSFSTRNLETV